MGFLYSKCALMCVIPLLVIVLSVKTEHTHRDSAVCINVHGATFQKTGMLISTAVPASNSVGGTPFSLIVYLAYKAHTECDNVSRKRNYQPW
jgi:hypothetical protein